MRNRTIGSLFVLFFCAGTAAHDSEETAIPPPLTCRTLAEQIGVGLEDACVPQSIVEDIRQRLGVQEPVLVCAMNEKVQEDLKIVVGTFRVQYAGKDARLIASSAPLMRYLEEQDVWEGIIAHELAHVKTGLCPPISFFDESRCEHGIDAIAAEHVGRKAMIRALTAMQSYLQNSPEIFLLIEKQLARRVELLEKTPQESP